MDFHEALQEVLDAASQPKQYPPGVTPVALSGDALDTQELESTGLARVADTCPGDGLPLGVG